MGVESLPLNILASALLSCHAPTAAQQTECALIVQLDLPRARLLWILVRALNFWELWASLIEPPLVYIREPIEEKEKEKVKAAQLP